MYPCIIPSSKDSYLIADRYYQLEPKAFWQIKQKAIILHIPGDFRSWESLFVGLFEHVERFRNLKFAVKKTTNIQSTVLSSSEGTATIHLAFK